ncbi:UDP-glucose/GDP-mannose dehydrogenase family protein [Candidatus Roizmanbacteria bacterium]|nr:UDP-glucose/GDP-mannose dehydrogenase family protein [Candidatus Roizmanbacteria bacterium]
MALNIGNISVVGLGKLGTPFALAFASSGFEVHCFDVNKSIIEDLESGICALYEKGVNQLLKKCKKHLHFPTSYEDMIAKSDLTFIIVPTPSERDGSFTLKYIFQVLKELGRAVGKKKKRHTIVITSTVSPQSMEKIAFELEKITMKKTGKEIGLCYSPEFIALGNVVQNLTHPDVILIGESDKESGDLLEKIRISICKNKPRIIRSNWINAEISKIALNTYVTMKISFANMIARVCEQVPEADAKIVNGAVGSDSRVGIKYLKGGLGFGGPCFPRDNAALAEFITSLYLSAEIPESVQSFNRKQVDYIFRLIKKHISNKNKTIGILGLSYKPETDVIEESQGVLLAQKFISEGYKVHIYDPAAMENAKKVIPDVQFTKSIGECIGNSDIIIVATPWDEFIQFDWKNIKNKSHKIIIDCWGCLNENDFKANNTTYLRLGSYLK